jgi:hypothetical protein
MRLRGADMATEINAYDQTLCTVAATLTAASFGMAGGATAEQTVLRCREVLAELANGGESREAVCRTRRGVGSC